MKPEKNSSSLRTDLKTHLQEQLGYHFKNEALLVQALTHRSYGHEHHPEKLGDDRDNERLEFLGDAVLQLSASDLLIAKFPQAPEGMLSKWRAALVGEKPLVKRAKEIGLGELIRLGKGEHLTSGAEKPSILSGCFEALFAAIYLDGGMKEAHRVALSFFTPALEELHLVRDFKSELQHCVQERYKLLPVYRLKQSFGPHHAPIFEMEVWLEARCLATASGRSKKEAQEKAAEAALQSLKGDRP